MTKTCLEGLESRGVVFDLLRDYDDIAELNVLAVACESPKPSVVTDAILDYPVDVAGLKFRDLTIAARLWCKDIAFPALEHHPILYSMAIPFAMCNRDRLKKLTEPGQVKRAVWRWVFLRCRKLTNPQLMNVLNWFGMAGDEDDAEGDTHDDESKQDQFGHIIAILTREYGGKPEYWIFDAPPETVRLCINDVITKSFHEHQAVIKSNQGAAKHGKAIAPDPNSPQMRAHKAFIDKLRAFEAEHTPMVEVACG